MGFFKSAKKKAKRFWFRARVRPVFRDSERLLGINIPRVIGKTPKVRGKRLALKQITDDLPREKIARRAIEALHKNKSAETYTFRLSKRFPPVAGKRAEIYYDRPSLKDLLEMHNNRRVRNFLKANNLTSKKAAEIAMAAMQELTRNISWAEIKNLDLEGDQLIADSFSDGKLNIICVDI